jgi:hypothetical protein
MNITLKHKGIIQVHKGMNYSRKGKQSGPYFEAQTSKVQLFFPG